MIKPRAFDLLLLAWTADPDSLFKDFEALISAHVAQVYAHNDETELSPLFSSLVIVHNRAPHPANKISISAPDMLAGMLAEAAKKDPDLAEALLQAANDVALHLLRVKK